MLLGPTWSYDLVFMKIYRKLFTKYWHYHRISYLQFMIGLSKKYEVVLRWKTTSGSYVTQMTWTYVTCLWPKQQRKDRHKVKSLADAASVDEFGRVFTLSPAWPAPGSSRIHWEVVVCPAYKHWPTIVTFTCVICLRNKLRETIRLSVGILIHHPSVRCWLI